MHSIQTIKIFSTMLFISTLLLSTQTQAKDADVKPTTSSNLSNFTYPTHDCGSKPLTPTKIPGLVSFIDVDAYNIAIAQYNVKVAIYNKKIKVYKKCINDYVAAGNNDIKIIRDQQNSALNEARTK